MRTVSQILSSCTILGIPVDSAPLVKYRESPAPNPKWLWQMDGLALKADMRDGKCHPQFSRNKVNSIYSRDPNLAALPPEGRAMLVPEKGHVMLNLWLRFSELRAVQVLSQDEDYKAFLDMPDPHQYMADKLGISRSMAKATGFYAIYLFSKEWHPIHDYLQQFPKLASWVYSQERGECAPRRLVTQVLDTLIPQVDAVLMGSGGRILYPMIDSLILTCPVPLEEQVKAELLKVCTPNLLNAEVSITSGKNAKEC